jgi:hypothetical protein
VLCTHMQPGPDRTRRVCFAHMQVLKHRGPLGQSLLPALVHALSHGSELAKASGPHPFPSSLHSSCSLPPPPSLSRPLNGSNVSAPPRRRAPRAAAHVSPARERRSGAAPLADPGGWRRPSAERAARRGGLGAGGGLAWATRRAGAGGARGRRRCGALVYPYALCSQPDVNERNVIQPCRRARWRRRCGRSRRSSRTCTSWSTRRLPPPRAPPRPGAAAAMQHGERLGEGEYSRVSGREKSRGGIQ